MTAHTTTTARNNSTENNVRSAVIRDLWATVHQMPGMCKYNFSCEMVMRHMMSCVMNHEGEYLNANSDYTFGRVRLCEWEAFDKKCWRMEVTYQMMIVAKNEPDKYVISDDMYSEDDLPDEPVEN